MNNVVVIIPIYKPDNKFKNLLEMLKQQVNISFDLCIVDSGSDFNDYREELEGLNYQIVKTNPHEFNHGGTRQRAADLYKKYPLLVYMTQDAIPADEFALSNLLKVFDNLGIGCAYGRQLPHKNATVLAARARMFNYPPRSMIKTKESIKELGIKVSFISDTFAAYRHEALDLVGGFPKDVILGEDAFVASKMILAGFANAYCADAKVYHSHNYSVFQEFKRYFDTGVFHTREPWIRSTFGQAEGEGVKFVINELKYFLKFKPWIIPDMIIRDTFKFLGYRLGIKEKMLPLWIKEKISMNKLYWG